MFGIDRYPHFQFHMCIRSLLNDAPFLAGHSTENGQGTRIGEPVNVNLRLKKVKDTKKILLKENEKITVEYKIAEKLIAPVQNESCIGAVYYKLGNMVLREYHVETVEKIEAVDLLWCMKQVLKTAL